MAPGGCFFSSVALSTAPFQGSSGPFSPGSCLLLSYLQGATYALALLGSLSHCKFVVGASSALPSAPFPQGFLPVQNSQRLEGLQACCPIWSCHFLALPVCNRSVGQARECFSCITGQEVQRSKFWKAKRMLVINVCPALENAPRYHTLLLLLLLLLLLPLLCVVGPGPRSPSSHSPGNRDRLACIPAATFCSSVTCLCKGSCKGLFSKLN